MNWTIRLVANCVLFENFSAIQICFSLRHGFLGDSHHKKYLSVFCFWQQKTVKNDEQLFHIFCQRKDQSFLSVRFKTCDYALINNFNDNPNSLYIINYILYFLLIILELNWVKQCPKSVCIWYNGSKNDQIICLSNNALLMNQIYLDVITKTFFLPFYL